MSTAYAISEGYWSCPTSDPSWCPTCRLPSCVTIERRVACVDNDGATSLLVGRFLYCTGHLDFVGAA